MFRLNWISFCFALFFTKVLFAEELPSSAALSYDAELSNYEYEFDVNFYTVESQDQSLKMAYIYLKGSEDKPVITLVHGKNFNADYWARTAGFLNKQGYGVLMPDQLGFGKSSKPKHYQFSFPVLAKNTHDLIQSLGIEETIVIGHSMGGMLASRFSLMYPNLTRQLILLNPIGLENYLQYVDYKDTDFFYQNELKKTPEKLKAYQQKNYYDGAWNADYESLTHFIIGQIQGPDKEHIAWVNALTYDMIFTQPVITEFEDFSIPVSLIIGTRDRTGPGRKWKKSGVDYELGRYDQLGKKAAEMIPNSKLYELEGLGHLPHIEDFDQFKQALQSALEFTKN